MSPVSMDAMAPWALYRRQHSDNTIIGQKVAAMPDHPKMTNQKIVRPGTRTATAMAIPSAITARVSVTRLDRPVRVTLARSGCSVC